MTGWDNYWGGWAVIERKAQFEEALRKIVKLTDEEEFRWSAGAEAAADIARKALEGNVFGGR